MNYYVTVDGRPWCSADETLELDLCDDKSEHYCEADGSVQRARPVCGHQTREAAEATAKLTLKHLPAVTVAVVAGACPQPNAWVGDEHGYEYQIGGEK